MNKNKKNNGTTQFKNEILKLNSHHQLQPLKTTKI